MSGYWYDESAPQGLEDGTSPEPAGPPRCDKALDTASEVCPRCFRQHTWLLTAAPEAPERSMPAPQEER